MQARNLRCAAEFPEPNETLLRGVPSSVVLNFF
jgi:hypothetical protein